MGQANKNEREPGSEAAACIAELKEEHRALLMLYQEIDSAVARGELAAVAVLMQLFRDGLVGHLSKENREIYTQLHSTGGRRFQRELVSHFFAEMASIERLLYTFVECYSGGVTDDEMEAFKRDFLTAGELLKQRIHAEETLLYDEYLRQRAISGDC